MAIPLYATGSLSPTFVPAPPVGVTVKLPSAFALFKWFPTILREPLSASDTLSEATAQVKLPAWHCPTAGSRRLVRNPILQGWYPNSDSDTTGVISSQSPTYPVHAVQNPSIKLKKSSMGSFRPGAGNQHLHWYFNFTGCIVETASKSLRLSCGSELTRQGISLP